MATVATIIEHYHRLRRQGDTEGARGILALALQVPEHCAEAQMLKGVEAMQAKDYPEAFLWLGQAAEAMPKRPDIPALLGRVAMAQNQPELARKLLEAAWRRHPLDPTLRIALWQARAATQSSDETATQMRRSLQYMESGDELRHVLRYLAQAGTGAVGVSHYTAKDGAIEGWAINLQNPQQPAALQLHIGNQAAPLAPNQPHQPLADAGYPARHGAFRVKLPPQSVPVRITNVDGIDLNGSPLAITGVLPGVPGFPFKNPATNPAHTSAKPTTSIKAKSQKGSHKQKRKSQPNLPIVNVLIPVYEGLEETLACVNSVLRYRKANRTPHQIIVLNDASPNTELTRALQAFAELGQISHVLRPVNLGFIRNMNRGMALHPDRDVVWLNADTMVHGDWLDRLRQAAYADEKTASSCPFSNNGELLSYPEPLKANPMPSAAELAELDLVARKQPGKPVQIETGCGFCLYIKRAALDAVGYLDEVELLRGYGEETDWCLRARALGWQHVAATNTFVAHRGGTSFKDEKVIRARQNNALLRKRYPHAKARFDVFTRKDPLALAREIMAKTNIGSTTRQLHTQQGKDAHDPMDNSRILYITGNLREQAGLPPTEAPLRLTFRQHGPHTVASLQAHLGSSPAEVEYSLPNDAKQLLQDLKKLPIDRLVYEQALNGCSDTLLQLPETLSRPHVIRSLPCDLAQSSPALMRLLNTAEAIQVPYAAHVLTYSKALPNATITTLPTAPLDIKTSVPDNLPGMLVVDVWHHSAAIRHWVQIAQQLARRKERYGCSPILFVPGNAPWQEELMATGVASRLPEVEGVTCQEVLASARCTIAISLDDSPDASWLAPELARSNRLPLYAPASAVARQAGARPLNELSAIAPWIIPQA